MNLLGPHVALPINNGNITTLQDMTYRTTASHGLSASTAIMCHLDQLHQLILPTVTVLFVSSL
jgi:hypothetical protein